MNDKTKTTRVNLDGFHSLDVTVNERARTVVAELITGEETTFIYAEKFDVPCNYLRAAIKKGIVYLNGKISEANHMSENEKGKICICLNTDRYVV